MKVNDGEDVLMKVPMLASGANVNTPSDVSTEDFSSFDADDLPDIKPEIISDQASDDPLLPTQDDTGFLMGDDDGHDPSDLLGANLDMMLSTQMNGKSHMTLPVSMPVPSTQTIVDSVDYRFAAAQQVIASNSSDNYSSTSSPLLETLSPAVSNVHEQMSVGPPNVSLQPPPTHNYIKLPTKSPTQHSAPSTPTVMYQSAPTLLHDPTMDQHQSMQPLSHHGNGVIPHSTNMGTMPNASYKPFPNFPTQTSRTRRRGVGKSFHGQQIPSSQGVTISHHPITQPVALPKTPPNHVNDTLPTPPLNTVPNDQSPSSTTHYVQYVGPHPPPPHLGHVVVHAPVGVAPPTHITIPSHIPTSELTVVPSATTPSAVIPGPPPEHAPSLVRPPPPYDEPSTPVPLSPITHGVRNVTPPSVLPVVYNQTTNSQMPTLTSPSVSSAGYIQNAATAHVLLNEKGGIVNVASASPISSPTVNVPSNGHLLPVTYVTPTTQPTTPTHINYSSTSPFNVQNNLKLRSPAFQNQVPIPTALDRGLTPTSMYNSPICNTGTQSGLPPRPPQVRSRRYGAKARAKAAQAASKAAIAAKDAKSDTPTVDTDDSKSAKSEASLEEVQATKEIEIKPDPSPPPSAKDVTDIKTSPVSSPLPLSPKKEPIEEKPQQTKYIKAALTKKLRQNKQREPTKTDIMLKEALNGINNTNLGQTTHNTPPSANSSPLSDATLTDFTVTTPELMSHNNSQVVPTWHDPSPTATTSGWTTPSNTGSYPPMYQNGDALNGAMAATNLFPSQHQSVSAPATPQAGSVPVFPNTYSSTMNPADQCVDDKNVLVISPQKGYISGYGGLKSPDSGYNDNCISPNDSNNNSISQVLVHYSTIMLSIK